MPVSLFDRNVSGSGAVGTLAWIDLGVIPAGYKIWIGNVTWTSPDKSITFELRTNLAGQSSGSDGATSVLSTCSVSARTVQVVQDLYRKGRLHTATVPGTGTEHWWVKLKSKSGSSGSYMYSVNYTWE